MEEIFVERLYIVLIHLSFFAFGDSSHKFYQYIFVMLLIIKCISLKVILFKFFNRLVIILSWSLVCLIAPVMSVSKPLGDQ